MVGVVLYAYKNIQVFLVMCFKYAIKNDLVVFSFCVQSMSNGYVKSICRMESSIFFALIIYDGVCALTI